MLVLYITVVILQLIIDGVENRSVAISSVTGEEVGA